MDITEYLKRIKESPEKFSETSNIYESIALELHEQKDEIDKKIHLIQALEIVDWLKKLSSFNFYENLSSGIIMCEEKTNYNYMIIHFYKNEDGLNCSEAKLSEMLENFQFNIKNVSKELVSNKEVKFLTAPGFENRILNLLLSKELKNMLTYNELQLSMPENDNSIKRKNKI